MLGSRTETSYSVIDYHITSNKKKLKVSMYKVNSRSIAILITVMYDATHNPSWWLHRRKVVARRASTTQKDTATVDGERDTKFTKVVAMVTGTISPFITLPVPEEANLEWQSFFIIIVLVCAMHRYVQKHTEYV